MATYQQNLISAQQKANISQGSSNPTPSLPVFFMLGDIMTTTVGAASMRAAKTSVTTIESVNKLAGEIDTADIFLKLVKKAEDAAQAGT